MRMFILLPIVLGLFMKLRAFDVVDFHVGYPIVLVE